VRKKIGKDYLFPSFATAKKVGITAANFRERLYQLGSRAVAPIFDTARPFYARGALLTTVSVFDACRSGLAGTVCVRVLIGLGAFLIVRAATAIRIFEATLQVFVRLFADLARLAVVLRGGTFIGFVRQGRRRIVGVPTF
jgi:hypothetical protein